MVAAADTSAVTAGSDAIAAVAGVLGRARSALVITGPGLAADSQLVHYRGLPGLVRQSREDGRAIEAALSPDMLRRKPSATWARLLEMDAAVRAAQPNRGHEVLVAIEQRMARLVVVTVNVDRLHQRAGSRNVIEMHGALHDLLCTHCELSTRHERFDRLPVVPPRCATCDTVLRPDMPLFGEALPVDPFTRLQAEMDTGFDAVFAVGVGTMFPYLARPILVAKADGVPTVEIGLARTDVSDVVDHRLQGSPAALLAALAAAQPTLAP